MFPGPLRARKLDPFQFVRGPGALGARTMFREFGRVEFFVQASLHITPGEIGFTGFDGANICKWVAVQRPVIGFRNRIHEGRLLFNTAVGQEIQRDGATNNTEHGTEQGVEHGEWVRGGRFQRTMRLISCPTTFPWSPHDLRRHRIRVYA